MLFHRANALPQPESEHSLQRRQLAVDRRRCGAVLQSKRLVPLDRCRCDVDGFRATEYGIKPRQPRRFQITQTLPLVVRVVGDDEVAQFDVPVLGLADLAFGVAIRALKNASGSLTAAGYISAPWLLSSTFLPVACQCAF